MNQIVLLALLIPVVYGASIGNETDFLVLVVNEAEEERNKTVEMTIDLETLGVTTEFDPVESGCQINDSILEEIRSHAPMVDKIINYILNEDKGQTYDKLSEFVDKFGHRFSGSQSLEDSIDFLLDQMNEQGLENVHGEDVTVPHWVRGRETLNMLEPRNKSMSILGLGLSVATPKEGIMAEAIVVSSFDELEAKKDQVEGKIVVYAYEFRKYSQAFAFRYLGADRASKLGAVASLTMSCTDFSLYTPHTGIHTFSENVTAIPAASITVEDAQTFLRLSKKGEKITLHLLMEDLSLPDSISRNVVAEIKGEVHPEELVIIGGHVDSWDVGQGAMDDGGGVFISYRALEVLKKLGLRPKRTLRTVLWTAEEVNLNGAEAYFEKHKEEADNMSIAMESDYGTFEPLGLSFNSQSNGARCVVKEILNLLGKINADRMFIERNGADIEPFGDVGVPTASLKTRNARYFYYHHTEADTMTMMNSDHLDLCLAVWTSTAYVLANLENKLDRQ